MSSASMNRMTTFKAPEEVRLEGIELNEMTAVAASDVPGSPPEPVYGPQVQKDVQGNVLPGFNKPHQHFLFYDMKKVEGGRAFLKWILPRITTMSEVVGFRRLYRARRLRLGRGKVDLYSTWINVALNHEAVARLTTEEEAAKFSDVSFKQGLAERSSYLGDPTSKRSRGHPEKWKVGGPKNEADIIVIVASDIPDKLDERVDEITNEAKNFGLNLIFDQRGDVLPGNLRGHEHFGFRDGISQPGVRGKLSNMPGDYITPRYIDGSDPRRLYFAKPGQQLIWPGQILLGEPRQSTEDHINSGGGSPGFPEWARRGSFLVVRRLHQDVTAFWDFVDKAASKLGIDRTKFASLLVGRWPSGAPLMRTPVADDPALAGDEFANNHFIFDDDTRPSNLQPIPGYPGDNAPAASADFLAQVCPHFAHIRKVHPRDTATEMGKPEDSFVHMILRRGIPYGRQLIGVKNPSKGLIRADRGLMFLCYASTIEDQFEFLQRRWANSPAQPNLGGHDPVIGQNGASWGRTRFIDVPTPAGSVRINIKDEWVIPTGGGYFFAPTISAIRDVFLR